MGLINTFEHWHLLTVSSFSGVAWALTTAPNDINMISSWGGERIGRNFDSDKVPTNVTYDDRGNVMAWGFDRLDRGSKVEWFKLLLSEEAERRATEQRTILDGTKQILNKLKKSPVEVVTDYLTQLWDHTMAVIRTRVTKLLLENLTIKIVLTVPAIWDHVAQALTREAAEKAGLLARPGTTLHLIGEPEAAALAVFNDAHAHGRHALKV